MRTSQVTKVFHIDNNSYAAFAFNDLNWVRRFITLTNASKSSTGIERLTDAAKSYNKMIQNDWGEKIPSRLLYHCVYATYDKIYDCHPGALPEEETDFDRVVGGEAVDIAEVYVREAEYFMNLIWETGTWSHVSTRLAERFCWILLDILEGHDTSVHGKQVYEIKKGVPPKPIFWKDIKDRDNSPIKALMQSVWEEVTPDMVVRADQKLNLLPSSLRNVLYSYGKGREKWD